MRIDDLAKNLSAKYYGEPADSLTRRHIVEDVKSTYKNVDSVEVIFDNYDTVRYITLNVTFKTEEDYIWYFLRWE